MPQLDSRLNVYRADLADARLYGKVEAARFVEGRPARVVVGRAAVRARPMGGGEAASFYHYGEELLVFDEADGCAWCQSQFDGYVGYVDAAHIALGAAPAPSLFVANMGAFAYPEPDLRGQPVDFLPRHAAVVVTETGILTRNIEYARLDTGAYLPLRCLAMEPPRSSDLVAAAQLYLGCPYLWGGRDFFGIDCSGLVQAAFRDLGIVVLRDSDMQAVTIGRRLDARGEAELRRGDLIYLPGHVLIYEGEGSFIHADGGNMMVRRDNLREWLDAHRLTLGGLTVRRDHRAGGG